MKKFFMLLALLVTFSVSAQINTKWVTNHKQAISIAESQDKNIIVFASDNTGQESIIDSELFNSEDFKAIQSNFIFLKLDVNVDAYNKRLAAHYSGVKKVPVVALISNKGNSIGSPLSVINSTNIKKFITLLKANIK